MAADQAGLPFPEIISRDLSGARRLTENIKTLPVAF